MSEKVRNPGEQRLHCNIKKWKKSQFKILHDISENVTLVQLMDSAGNVNHAVSIVGYWIFDSNYKQALSLTLDSLNIICSPSVGEGMFTLFESVVHAVRYTKNTGKLVNNRLIQINKG